MLRIALQHLKNWLELADRKPLVIRGARQVGKTWLVKHFAEVTGRQLIELNFEKQPAYAGLFDSNDPKQVLLNLSTLGQQGINIDNAILFLDEIQMAPDILSKLRWFAEDLPQLPVIAAGSLLEFVLDDHSFSMPVGRISYLHLEPLSFQEFLLAQGQEQLHFYLENYVVQQEIPAVIHAQLIASFKEYLLVGGMPGVVANWIVARSYDQVSQRQHDLLATYRDDFAKYKGRFDVERLDEVMMAIPRMLGRKFVASQVNPSVQSSAIKQVLKLLEKARISHRVLSSSANGVPLASEIKDKYFKVIFLDVGLCGAALGLNLNHLNAVNEINMINNGAMAEQIVGQMLRTIFPFYIEPALYYWHRETAGTNAEIDYVIAHENQIIPIEVKAGATGSLKSLHLFMGEKKSTMALRINSEVPTLTPVNVKNNLGKLVNYRLLSIPFYLTEQIPRLLKSQETSAK